MTVTELCSNVRSTCLSWYSLSEASVLLMVSARIPDRLCWVRDTVDDGEIT